MKTETSETQELRMQQVKKLKSMYFELKEILPLIEKTRGRKMKLLRNTEQSDFFNDCEQYIDEKLCGCSEIYYGGTKEDVDWLIGIRIFENEIFFEYEKCYILGDDFKQRFETIKELKNYLIEKGLIRE